MTRPGAHFEKRVNRIRAVFVIVLALGGSVASGQAETGTKERWGQRGESLQARAAVNPVLLQSRQRPISYGVRVAANVEEMAAISGKEDSVLFLAGPRGGGTPFIWTSAGVVDDVLTFRAANGYWVRQAPAGKIYVTWAGAVPQSNYDGADQTAAIQKAIDALPRRQSGTILIPQGWFPCDGPLDIAYDGGAGDNRRGPITLTGVSGPAFGQVQLQASRLIYRGSGRRFIDSRSNPGRIQNLAVYYSSPEFTGSLIDFSWNPDSATAQSSGDTNGAVVEHCTLGSYTNASGRPTSADNLLNFGNTVVSAVRATKFIGAQVGIRGMGWDQGPGLGTTYFANGVLVEGCDFQYLWKAAILNPAQAWAIRSNTFEFFRAEVMYDTPRDTGMDRAIYSDEFVAQTIGMEISGNWFGDPGGDVDPEIIISNGPAHWMGVSIHGNQFGATDTEKAIHLVGGVSGMSITGNSFSTKVGVEIDETSNARREGIVISGNEFTHTLQPVVGANRYGVTVFGNWGTNGTYLPAQWWGGIGELRGAEIWPVQPPLLSTFSRAGVRRMGFAPEGELQFFDPTLEAAGAELPERPLGFVIVLDSQGRRVKIPYYQE